MNSFVKFFAVCALAHVASGLRSSPSDAFNSMSKMQKVGSVSGVQDLYDNAEVLLGMSKIPAPAHRRNQLRHPGIGNNANSCQRDYAGCPSGYVAQGDVCVSHGNGPC